MNLEDLSRLQNAFDQSRGIADLPYPKGEAAGDTLARLEYAVIGLMGEVGEIANLVKKARRERALGVDVSGQLSPALSGEVADVLSYLLKLASEAQIDFSHAYLAKMCRNAHRFHSKVGPSTITIAGPPGSGKTSVVSALAPLVGADRIYIERPENNPFLDRLDRPSTQFDASASQGWFLNAIAKFVGVSKGSPLVLDQDPTAIALVYGGLLHDRGELSRTGFEEHIGALLNLEIDAADQLNGRLVLLLDAPPAVLAWRCAQKPRTPLDKTFLGLVRERFISTFAGLPNVITINADRPLADVTNDVAVIATRILPGKL